MQDVTKLRVWQRARDLAAKIEREMEWIDDGLRPDLPQRVRQSAAAIHDHIARGAAQPSPAEFARCLHDAINATTMLQSSVSRIRPTLADAPRSIMLDFEIREVARMLMVLRKRVLERAPNFRK